MPISRRVIAVVAALFWTSILVPGMIAVAMEAEVNRPTFPSAALPMNGGTKIYLPIVPNNYPWMSPFGFEAFDVTQPAVYSRAAEVGARWIRLGPVSWQSVEPNQDDPYGWSSLEGFEKQLLAARKLGLTPTVVVGDSPAWATINRPFPTSCGAIREDRFADFAAFMSALVARYKEPPYNVHYWELGNEPDVDPTLVAVNNMFGCWGDKNDFFYGGELYGKMLRAVTPAIKRADPNAKVLIGGLLLDSLNSETTDRGKPERFFEGILRAGADPYFDIVAYHLHPAYWDSPLDYSGAIGSWVDIGGYATGKVALLREVMSQYGVSKPLFLNETSLFCPGHFTTCSGPSEAFLEAQADHVARMMVRTLSVGVNVISWYTLDGPGWNSSSLLDGDQEARPSYKAYRQLYEQIRNSHLPPSSVRYGTGIEAYRFRKGLEVVDVVWSVDTTPDIISIPRKQFIAASSRDGDRITPSFINGNAELQVGFSAVYIHRLP